MLKNISIIIKRCLIYSLIFVFALPLSVLAFGAPKAAASEKKVIEKPKVVEKSLQKPIEKPKTTDILAPVLLDIDGLSASSTYFQGQKIKWQLTFNEDNLAVWAETDSFDTNFPSVWPAKLLSDHFWQLETPVLSSTLVAGGHVVTLKARDAAGNLFSRKIKIVLKETTLVVKENGRNSKPTVNLKTPQKAISETVAGESVALKPPVTPSITPQAATTKKIASTSPNVTPKSEEKTITPSLTPTPAENPKDNDSSWSKLLVALSILIIAAGAAIGGYYGYEWLMLRGKDKEPPESSSRW